MTGKPRWLPPVVIVGLGIVLFVLSGVFQNDRRGIKWVLGGIGWFGFLLCVLLLIVWAIVTVAQNRRTRATVE